LNLAAFVGTATASADHVEFDMTANGYAIEARNALASTSSPNFQIVVTQFGQLEKDLGATSGDTTFTIEESTLPITSPQTGDVVLDEINKGSTIGASFELKDTSAESVRQAIGFYGSLFVTDDAASKTIAGHGTKRLYTSTLPNATRLVFRPTKNAADENPEADFTIHKARLKLGEITFSAEDELVLPIEAIGYLDTSKVDYANIWSYGDGAAVPDKV
jgi:hypothetical protein